MSRTAQVPAVGVHHGANVIHSCLKVRQPNGTIGKAGATLVESNQPRERPQSLEQPRRGRVLPVIVEMRYESGNEHEIEPAPAGHLVMTNIRHQSY